jgi:hypothetical protein
MPNGCALSPRYSDIWRFCCDYKKPDATVVLSDTGDGFVNFKLEFK